MAVASLIPSTTTTTTSSSSAASEQLFSDYNDFLLLLTEQLQNQDPLDPMDTNEFTNQLVQYSQLEQQINTNEQLEAQTTLDTANTMTQTLSYIGVDVEVAGNTAYSDGNGAIWSFYLSESSQNITAQVLDENGDVVSEEVVSGDVGGNEYEWDGLNDDGDVAEEGLYTLKMTPLDSEGNTITVELSVHSQVTGVDTTGTLPVLLFEGGQASNLEDVISLSN
ncbi:flagellar hook assembly protein FlgD [Kiloniella sp.]|uniref:flagellar hook assembly protein FlgD n=1 Tax=Kiloniella sp. TaxID=1938587 RepID=UPI003B016B6A